ncbi:MAG: hypothetical protein ACOC57_05380, partial [Acidobacteriota bacterium]
MKQKILIFLITPFLLLSILTPLEAQGVLLKRDIHVGPGEVQENIITFGGHVVVEGIVKESIVAFGGTVIVSGEVGDIILGFGADIELKPEAVVKGDVVSLGGTLNRAPGARIDGDTIFFKTSDELWESLKQGFVGLFGISLIPLFISFKRISLFIWFILALIIAALFPKQVTLASRQIKDSFWGVFGIGLLSIIIFSGLVLFSALISLILIGIPLLIALIFIGLALKIFSRVVIFCFLGEALARA